ncbi:ECF-type sigma factor [Singulisphaera sp. Ch08]|uniref:ECF-type sigma factor n=1 Tax=Singulisphaera sp. Ch08 TaxID=3120278 RepID=A0AAU7CN63_9BACT
MTTEDKGSVSIWVGNLKAGDQAAAQKLWDRYFDKLVHVARAKLRASRRPGIIEDEEDAALSAFDSLCAGAALGRFPQLADRDDLWKLLVVITARKAVDQMQREGRQKRGGGRVVGESTLAGPIADEGLGGLDQMVGSEPSPEFAVMVADEHRRLLNLLGDETLRRIAIWKMEGYTNEEIRLKLGCSLRTVANKLELIRRTWLDE